ncbi:YafY family protein [Clavibacter sp. VKM Ac-2542]|uniref:helix-turn-helix transcriptional regulator n=1 Tax=Clavibacter TaxID=1573 RepID=UPI00188DA01D|nr:WYL domain-containing protein [Clavibacter sp. VKM Ac-2542]MBF4619820.1 WYL domain-containing protein [Clavibacter sp. VKM Ac-2542]
MTDRAAPLQAQDKLAFLLALVPYLTDHGRVSVSQAAAHFRVPPEQIRQAVRLIAVSGVPGSTASYQHGDLFDIAWDDFEDNDQIVITHMVAIDDSPRFSAREAAALIAGLQYVSSQADASDLDLVGQLMAKLARGSSASPSQVAVAAGAGDGTRDDLRRAIAEERRVEFDYRSPRGGTERRVVDPLRLESMDEDWYLRGWDLARGAVRTFRLDRLDELVVTDLPPEHRPQDVVLGDTLFEPSPDDLRVTLEVQESALPLLGDFVGDERPVPVAGRPGRVAVTVRVAHYQGLVRLVAGMAGVVVVTSPPEARAAVAEWAERAAAAYDDAG